MIKSFLRGMSSINLFPNERKSTFNPVVSILSDEEAFKKDIEMVAKDMWTAIEKVSSDNSECR